MKSNALLRSGLLLAGIVALSLPMSAEAAVEAKDLTIGSTYESVYTIVKPDQPYEFLVTNPTFNPAYLVIPSMDVDMLIPAHSERAITIDMSSAGAGDRIDYQVKDETDEKVVVNGFFTTIDPDAPKVAEVDANRFAAFLTNTQQTLDELIQRNQVTAANIEPDPEPQYYTSTPSRSYERGSSVGGHW